MTPEQALQALKSAAELAPMQAKDHMVCQRAYEVLLELIKPKE